MSNVLKTGIRNARNVDRYLFAPGAIRELGEVLDKRRHLKKGRVVFLIDEYFSRHTDRLDNLRFVADDQLIYISTTEEPTTEFIDNLLKQVLSRNTDLPCAVVGIGGGTTMDSAKAISNLLTNGGRTEDYQGWDLVRKPGVYKIGIPTLSGTGAEATRTCVITNKETGLKMGMNSDYTVFDQLILDPNLTATIPREQYFFTGLDTWIHCIESLNGNYRNFIGDAFSAQAVTLCREVFKSDEMMSDSNRKKLMVASYLGGCAIATSYVGVVHPFSAGLSVVLGLHHCVANCITMKAMESFYPAEHREFLSFLEKQAIDLPQDICANLSDEQHEALYQATIVHDKPLTNALGDGFLEILTESRVKEIFEHI